MADDADDIKVLVADIKSSDPVMAKQSDAVVEGVLHRWANNTPGVLDAWHIREQDGGEAFLKQYRESKANVIREARGEREVERPKDLSPVEMVKLSDREWEEHKRKVWHSEGTL